MSKPFDFLVFIGRFQPFHIGHHDIVKQALMTAERVILVIGSHNSARSPRNPFTTEERIDIIRASFSSDENERISFCPQVDYTYNEEKWVASIRGSVDAIIHSKWRPGPVKVSLIGYDKDHTSYYLKLFPDWGVVNIHKKYDVDATHVRNAVLFEDKEYDWAATPSASLIVRHLKLSDEIQKVVRENTVISQYKRQWACSPYPPTFVTVDAVVTQSGHILLVKRKEMPGEGLWALPGGFVGQTETLREAMLRELREETKIDVPVPVLAGSIVKNHTYDAPNRSARGRTITEAYHIKLADREYLPSVKGSDDAAKAKWFTLSEFVGTMRPRMFEDHFSIVEHMLGI